MILNKGRGLFAKRPGGGAGRGRSGHVAAGGWLVHGGAVHGGPRFTVDRDCGGRRAHAVVVGGGGLAAAAGGARRRHGRPRQAHGGGAAGHGKTRWRHGRGRHDEASPGRGSPWRMDGWTSSTTKLAAARLTAVAARELGELAARVRALGGSGCVGAREGEWRRYL